MTDYTVPAADLAFLQAYCRDDLVPPKPDRTRQAERRRILDRHAMAYSLAWLSEHFPDAEVVDANTVRTNQPGYDLLLDEEVRIQVKGRCWIEMIDFAVPSLEKMAAWESDYWICVDFAGLIDGRHGKYEGVPEMAPNGRIDVYVVPTGDLKALVQEHFPENKRPRLRAVKPGSLYSAKNHFPELFDYRNRFDLISVPVGNDEASPALEDESQMQAFCQAVGELVLWATEIDAQLTKAVIKFYSLTETPMLTPVVAELDARAKIELLKARLKHVSDETWSAKIKSWIRKVEKVNARRNMVAHHQVAVTDGKLVLHSDQARKLLKRIDGGEPTAAKTLADIHQWIESARAVFAEGETVLANLERFVEVVAERSR